MPLNRYQVRNEYSLADPELYKAADKDDPEALLEGVAMAGLVGVLRQLGDLAEFAAEIFHDLHEEVMVTATRGHTLMVRVQQLESEFPSIEKAFLSQPSHISFFSNPGTEWHPNLQMNQNLITKGDLPRFVMDSYEEARGPPRLFLLDKFDIAGAGSCLKRYTDPSFYKLEAPSFNMASVDVQRDKKFRKAKQKKGPRWKNGETPENLPSTKLHQLFLEERVESGASDPARLVKLKRKSSASAFGSENGKSYMEKFLKTPTEDKVVHEVPVGSSPLKLFSEKSTIGSGLESQTLSVSNVGPDAEPMQRIRGPYPPPSTGRTIVRPPENDSFEDIVEKTTSVGSRSNPSFDDKDIAVDGEINVEERESYHSDCDDASEIDNYMDALATMDSEVETDTEFRPKKKGVAFLNIEKHRTDPDPNDERLQSQSQVSDSQSIGNYSASDDGNSSIRKGVSSFSCSDDTASTSAEGTPSTENGETEVTEIHAGKAPLRPPVDLEAIFVEDNKSGELESNDASSETYEIFSDPPKREEHQTDDRSQFSSGPKKIEEQTTDESDEVSCGVSEIKEQLTDDNGKYSDVLMEMEQQLANVGILRTSDEITPRLLYEEHLEDEAELEDSYFNSSTVIDAANILEEIYEEEDGEDSLEDVVQTEVVDNVSDRSSVDTQVVSPDSVKSNPEEQPSVLHLDGLAGKANDNLSDKFDSEETGLLYSKRKLDEAWDRMFSRDLESDVEDGEIESRANPIASDLLSNVPESQYLPSLADDYSQSNEREDKMIHADGEVKRARESFLPEEHAQSDEREDEIVKSQAVVENAPISSLESECSTASKYAECNEQLLESEFPCDSSPSEEIDASLSSDHISVFSSLEEKVKPETDQLDLLPLDLPGSPESSSHLEPIDSHDHMNHKTDSDTDFGFDSFALSNPMQPLEQEKVLSVEELDVVGEVAQESSQPDLVQSNESDHESLPSPISGEASVSELPQSSDHAFDLSQQMKITLNPVSAFPGFNLLPEVAQLNLEEMPPLPPLPPMQWRMGKFQHASERDDGQHEDRFPPMFPSIHNENVPALNSFVPLAPMNVANSQHEDLIDSIEYSIPLPLQMSTPHLEESQDSIALEEAPSSNAFAEMRVIHAEEGVTICPTIDHSGNHDEPLALSQSQQLNPFEAVPATSDEKPQDEGEGEMIHPTVDHNDSRDDIISLGQTQSLNSFTTLPETSNEAPNEASHVGEGKMIQPTDSPLTPTPEATSTCSSETPNEESTQSPDQLLTKASVGREEHDCSSMDSEMKVVGPAEDFVPHLPVEDQPPEHLEPSTEKETVCTSSTSELPSVHDEKPNLLSSLDNEKSNGNQVPKLPRPRSPLIDAVAAHDKSKLRKVTERARPQEQKVEERDSLLDQIRMKSFNLKPAVATRPTIQGPRTNLRVAAILEKAKTIRQAFAGSDDDDEDSWSDE